MKQLLFFILLVGLTSSCAFNSQFLKPTILPPQFNQLTLANTETGDSLVTFFDQDQLPRTSDFQESEAIGFYIKGHWIPSSSGNKLYAWQIFPKSTSNGISIHIFPGNACNILDNIRNAVELSKKGFKVMLIDYSGFGFSEGKATRKNVLLDGETALKFLAENTDQSKEKIILYGQSLGGNLAAVVASNHQEMLDALVIEGAFSSHKDIAAKQSGFLGSMLVAELYSAEKSIGQFRKSVLIIHSRADKTVPFYMGEELYAEANEPKTFIEIDQEHLAGLKIYSEKIANETIKLLNH